MSEKANKKEVFTQRVNRIKTAIGNVNAGWRDVSVVFADVAIAHFNENSRAGELVAKLHNGLNVDNGNKTMAKAIKVIAKEYWGINKIGVSKDGQDQASYDRTLYMNHTDEEREAVLASLRAGELSKLYKEWQVANQTPGAGREQDNALGFQITKDMKTSLVFKEAAEFAHVLYQLNKEAGFEDDYLQSALSEIKEQMALVTEHLDGLKQAKAAMADKLKAEEDAVKAA